jgi:hypothetical protein
MIEKTLETAITQENSEQPFETGYGIWAKYGPAPRSEGLL